VQGLLVHGDNHFIVNGPMPDVQSARSLLWRWERPMLGGASADEPDLSEWSICTKAFRENLKWAMVVEGDAPPSEAVTKLLAELAAGGVVVHNVQQSPR
jgi:hypothetical protein